MEDNRNKWSKSELSLKELKTRIEEFEEEHGVIRVILTERNFPEHFDDGTGRIIRRTRSYQIRKAFRDKIRLRKKNAKAILDGSFVPKHPGKKVVQRAHINQDMVNYIAYLFLVKKMKRYQIAEIVGTDPTVLGGWINRSGIIDYA